MKNAKNYVTHAAAHIEKALNRMQVRHEKPVEYGRKEIIRRVEELLTIEEQRICDMATD